MDVGVSDNYNLLLGVGFEIGGGGAVLHIFSMYISASECPFYVDFSLDDHLKNWHLLSTLFLAK